MKQKKYKEKKCGESQSRKILMALLRNQGEWVAMRSLSRISGSLNVHSRISDIRNNGYSVMHKNERKGRVVCSSYQIRYTTLDAALS